MPERQEMFEGTSLVSLHNTIMSVKTPASTYTEDLDFV